MERAYKFLIAGLAVGLMIAAAGTFAITSSLNPPRLDCKQCHEGHGSVVAPGVNVNGTIFLTGDSPQDEYVAIDDIFKLKQIDITTLKQQDGVGVPSRGVSVFDFLKAHGINDFSQLVVYADDFETTYNKSELNGNSVIVPMEFSIRILGSDMPVNVWAKNIRTIVVVGGSAGDAITLNGKEVSYGQMLANGVDTLVYSRKTTGYSGNGRDYQFESGFVVPGIALKDLLSSEGYSSFSKVTLKGSASEKSLDRDEVLGGSYFVTRDQGKIKIATSDKSRTNWMDVESITVE